MSVNDRFVQQISSKPLLEEGRHPFSAYLHIPNIVLLGDPGAGKTYLFSEYARSAGGESLTARAFLNIDADSLVNKKVLFIDALDERRAGRVDHNAIDEIVRKLFQIKTEQVRIACRAADWLGETDLAAFRTFFKRAGGYVVLSLQPLSNQEQIDVLEARGVVDPATFLAEASDRGLDDFLGNPQNLTMLADVVRKGDWPDTRSQLFQKAVDILLEEHSDPQRFRQSGRFSSNELLEPAGELCAVRLISDIHGISLTENNQGDDLPSYRSLCAGDLDKAFSAMGRRAFISDPMTETVDYAHRTIAEYLGATWLAKRVRNGLPFGRVRALLGIDGRPASELRGLHAWLAVHLPEHAQALIDADPFGVLSYADARALPPRLRQYLLLSLAQLADVDPWFRDGHWSAAAVAGLSGPDMVEGFRSILANHDAGFSLRILILDSLSAGHVPPELAKDLQSVVVDPLASYAERHASVEALFRMEFLVAGFPEVYKLLGRGEDELRLRSEILRRLYGNHFGIDELVELFLDALNSNIQMPAGGLWHLAEKVADKDIGAIMDRLAEYGGHQLSNGEHNGASEVLREFDSLLIRYLTIDSNVQGNRLLNWLEFRRGLADHFGDGSAEKVRALLAANPSTVNRAVSAALQSLVVDEKRWGFVHRLRELMLFGVNDSLLLASVVSELRSESSREKKEFFYEIAMSLTFRIGQDARTSFEDLFSYAEGDQGLEAVRQVCSIAEIPDWRTEDAERRQEQSEKRDSVRAKNRADFDLQRESVRSGTHLAWLTFIAKVYFALFSDLDRNASPRDRLIAELGERDTEVALEGLISLVRRGEITELNEVIRMHTEHQHFPWWYAVIAGLDEYVEAGEDLNSLRDEYLQAALMIECLHPTLVQKGNVSHQQVHAWKSALLQGRPDLVVVAYVALSSADLARGAEHINGLHALLHEEALQSHRSGVALLLLKEYPAAAVQALHHLIPVAVKESDPRQLLDVAREAIAKSSSSSESRMLWLAAGFLVEPVEFSPFCNALESEATKQLVWAFRDLSGFARRQPGSDAKLSCQQIEHMLRLTFSQYPRTPHPTGGWSGDTNAWDATDYALKLLSLLSADSARKAAEALRRLLMEPTALSYVADIKHAIAQQQVRVVDAEFQQPGWEGAVAALANGTPAGISDLHALILDHLEDLGTHIAASNVDVYKRFWNEDSYGRVDSPKSEESCRDYLVELLKNRTRVQGISIEPEGHMAADKRADIVALLPEMKLVLELKRDYHREVWSSIQDQLERFYIRDPYARGFGIYVVFWFGGKRGNPIPKPPAPLQVPRSAKEMQLQLQSFIPPERASKVVVVVIDVSGEIPRPLA
ncbi:MAG: hypothetical protein Q8K29_11100 [Polaromonas sp.]|nr:hypothetical protein [Polaromonas sp.]